MYIPKTIRNAVFERAKDRCEFCLVPQSCVSLPFQIDHLIARKHRGDTALENLCLACQWCNSHKGTDLSGIDEVTHQVALLFNPREQSWREHFALDAAFIRGITPTGRATVATLKLNDVDPLAFRTVLLELGLFQILDSI